MRLGITLACPDGAIPKLLEDFTVELRDPDNRLYSHTAVQERGAGYRSMGVVIGFTPDQPGLWHVSVSFNPSIGIVAQSVEVVENHESAVAKVLEWQGHPTCEALTLNPLGTLTCVVNTGQGILSTSLDWVVRRPGAQDERFSATAIAFDGTATWEIDNQIVRRRQDTGVQTVTTHQGALPLAMKDGDRPLAAIAASGGRVLILDRNAVFEVAPAADGGLETTASLAVSTAVSPAALLVGAKGLAMFTTYPGESEGLFASNLDRIASREVVAQEFLGADGDAAWLTSGQSLLAFSVGEGRIEKTTALFPSGASVPRASNVSRAFPPLVRLSAPAHARRVVPRLEQSRVRFELYDPGPDFGPIAQASRRHAFAWSVDGGSVKVFERP